MRGRRLALWWNARRRALVAGAVLAVFALALVGLGSAAWCDGSRFGYFVQAQAAPEEAPAVDFTLDDAEAYPDIQRALDAVGTPVRAEMPEGARAFVDGLAEQGVAAVQVSNGKYYVAAYAQTPSATWTAVCE